jgi:hypothetical protein
MLMSRGSDGEFQVFDISNNSVTGSALIGQVGTEWQVAGFGDFSSRAGETDMLVRRGSDGEFQVFDISHNSVTGSALIGQVGTEWQIAGFGDFSSRAGETDMLMRNSNTGAFEVYDISHNVITFASPMGAVGSEWTVAGFSDFSGNPNESDMLMQATSGPDAGAFEVYDISHNAITSAAAMGAVGLEWQVAGIAADPPGAASSAGSIPLLMQAMASLGASASVNSAPSAVPGGSDTSQQPHLTSPH